LYRLLCIPSLLPLSLSLASRRLCPRSNGNPGGFSARRRSRRARRRLRFPHSRIYYPRRGCDDNLRSQPFSVSRGSLSQGFRATGVVYKSAIGRALRHGMPVISARHSERSVLSPRHPVRHPRGQARAFKSCAPRRSSQINHSLNRGPRDAGRGREFGRKRGNPFINRRQDRDARYSRRTDTAVVIYY